MYDGGGGDFPGAQVGAQRNTSESGTSISSHSWSTLDFAERYVSHTIAVLPEPATVVGKNFDIQLGAAF